MREKLSSIGVENWPSSVKIEFPSDVELARYDARRTALIRYSQGLCLSETIKEAGCSKTELYRLIARALKIDEYGLPYGHRILLKGQHVNKNRKNDERKCLSKKPLPGAFSLLLKNHPKIKKAIDDLVLQRASSIKICTSFKTACQNEGLQNPAYPFNSKSEGLTALKRYVRELENVRDRNETAQADFWRESASRAGSDDYYAPYRKVELDGYWFDVDSEVEYEGREPGSVVRIPVTRIWIVAVIDVASTCCLGYALDFGENYSTSTVLSALRNCMLPWKPRTSDSSIRYTEGDGFPSMHEELAYMCFDELHMDNAGSQLSAMALTAIHRKYRAVPVYGPVATPNKRPLVEGAFSIFEKAGFTDWKSIGRISYSVLHHAIDALLAAYNNSRSPGSTNTRMGAMRDMVSAAGWMNRRIPLREREGLQRYELADRARVRLDEKTRVVQWKGARYYGPCLLKVGPGAEVLVQANSQDPREILVTCCRTGQDLGILLVEKRWRAHPIHVRVRMWLESDPQLRHLRSQGSNIIDALHAYIGTKSRNAKQERKKAAIAQSFLRTGDSPDSVPRPANEQPSPPDTTKTSSHARPKGEQRKHASHAFVLKLLQNIGTL
ncbi:hypothetical protein [Variovorax sp. 3P27G3]|jgi:hypothetical protein|uniref:hypothetical protein n=1 Tax=Variovorax sp. 3P27G3 TaxID=2502214 RepID=UPI0010F7932C|nr:hypothetical protein [Variovorax sp. 3P27G3]